MMNNGSRFKFSLMFLLLVSLAGCSGKSDVRPESVEEDALHELRAEIRSAISDPEREAKAIAIVDEFSRELGFLKSAKMERQVQFKKLNANYDTTRAEFDVFLRKSNDTIYKNQQRVVKQHEAFVANTNSLEWAQILDARIKVIDSTFESVQSHLARQY